jgi:multiple sugar transport system ATP-binding protein
VARFIGSPGMNLVNGKISGGVIHLPGDNHIPLTGGWINRLPEALGGREDIILGYRPEAAEIKADGKVTGEVYAMELYGAYKMLHIEMEGSDIVHIRGDRLISYPIGTQVRFDLKPEMVRFFDPVTELAITLQEVPA